VVAHDPLDGVALVWVSTTTSAMALRHSKVQTARMARRLRCALANAACSSAVRLAAPPAVAKIRVQLRAEDFEVHHRGERLKLVANVAQPLEPFIHVEQSGRSRDACLPMLPRKLNHCAPDLARLIEAPSYGRIWMTQPDQGARFSASRSAWPSASGVLSSRSRSRRSSHAQISAARCGAMAERT
jgi:hypothetical protein